MKNKDKIIRDFMYSQGVPHHKIDSIQDTYTKLQSLKDEGKIDEESHLLDFLRLSKQENISFPEEMEIEIYAAWSGKEFIYTTNSNSIKFFGIFQFSKENNEWAFISPNVYTPFLKTKRIFLPDCEKVF